MSMDKNQEQLEVKMGSPPWSSTTKIIVSLIILVIVGGFLIRFKMLVGPILMVFILSYLLHPLIKLLSTKTKLSWRASVNIVFVVIILLFLSSATAIGVVLVQQLQSLLKVISSSLNNLPDLVMEISTREIVIGGNSLSLSRYFDANNLESLLRSLLDLVQPMLGQAGGILGSVASSTASTIGWTFLVIIISYFLLADIGKFPTFTTSITIPGYEEDLIRLWHELRRIWNAYLRGQFILFVLTTVLYGIMLAILGVRYAFAIAIVAGLARFIPYAGQWVTWIVIALVTLLQSSNYFGLASWQYMLLVLGVGVVIDTVFENFVAPRVIGETLGINPAVVLLAAIIGANLIGLVGVVLAAPTLATLKLLGQYIFRKLLDLPPFPEREDEMELPKYPWVVIGERIVRWVEERIRKRKKI